MILHIKNMVCDRCIMVVKQQIDNHNFLVSDISLGEVQFHPEPNEEQMQQIASSLKILGFEIIDKERDQLVEKIKNTVIKLVHHSDLTGVYQTLSSILAETLQMDYSYLSRVFSDHEDVTIEKFIIQQKIAKVKELLQYGELNMNEIAHMMGYSSNAHLSNQFKSITGLTPSQYKSIDKNDRKPLDKI
ncbi:helix-turn-helix transcriptional regulator [Mucilaginibacter rubeus]|uniref:Helix-turn-helix transcriptional regulator n=2 Tax=Mucilaginibacter rubeus TaxID=2027860 RepID=A0A364WQ88_9SPHI|nr:MULTISPECIES: helix-turn-helix domain-containing protein [Mucilaginibacter]QEM06145.1 helix-turn-helix transcriptional regulator [Mucilaginibacter rubeus]QEM13662.1 helix-turn-helix transcriptional regulator [Mucilaginibacter rubeus]QEM18725.1 helix-turn-helix transcriptional regulator [Mucilaginibacter gossypii]QTE36281.1 AraC family transcriptional regulator [Mucilaginibacter gossypii]QTE44734.1 helix-turn-helix transcriptional regulator [Mucilaginibacter rubeus]